VSKLDRLARSVPDARDVAGELERKGVTLALGPTVHDPSDPMCRMFFNIVATFAEFEADLIRMRTREGMAIARARGKLRERRRNCPKNRGKNSDACMTQGTTRSAISPRSSRCHAQPSTGR